MFIESSIYFPDGILKGGGNRGHEEICLVRKLRAAQCADYTINLCIVYSVDGVWNKLQYLMRNYGFQ